VAQVSEHSPVRLRQRGLSLDAVYLFTALAFLALRPLMTPIQPHDFWWHMATGRMIVETGTIPAVDTFSYTQAGSEFYNQGWLAQVLMYALYNLGSLPLLIIVQALVLATAYGILLALCIRRSGALRLSVVLLLLTTLPLSFDNWQIRPQSYAFPIFAVFLYILAAWRSRGFGSERRHRLWLLPALMVVWVNLHGSFVLGGVLITLVFIGEIGLRTLGDRRLPPAERPERPPLTELLLWGGITAAALLLNPGGVGVLSYVFNLLSSSQVTTLVQEWAPPTVRTINGMIFYLYLIFLLLIFAYTSRRPDPVDMLLLLPFLWLAFGAVRNIVWFGILAAPIVTLQLAAMLPQDRRRNQGLPLMNGLLIGLISMFLVLGLPWIKPHLGLPPQLGNLIAVDTPVEAVAELQQREPGPERLFHAMSYGSYLIWAAPDMPVFIDPRIELYPYEQWQDYLRLSNGRNVAELIAEYRFDGMLLSKTEQAPLIAHLAEDPAWRQVYADEQNTVFLPAR
jgi:hypothetical protein